MIADLWGIARALGGEVSGRQVLAPGPRHSPRDRSLSVRPLGSRLLIYSHAGDDWREIRDHVYGRLEFPQAARLPLNDTVKRDIGHKRRQAEKAEWLWRQRRPLAGSIAERYLREARGYKGPLPPTLGYLPPLKPEQRPAMIAAFALVNEPEPGQVVEPCDVSAIHLTLLRADGIGKADEIPNKICIGSPRGRPIALAPVNDLMGLAICEGIEDAVSAHAGTGLGAWAAGAAGFMPSLAEAVPSYIEQVTVYAHDDDAGIDAAHKLASALQGRGIAATIEGTARR